MGAIPAIAHTVRQASLRGLVHPNGAQGRETETGRRAGLMNGPLVGRRRSGVRNARNSERPEGTFAICR